LTNRLQQLAGAALRGAAFTERDEHIDRRRVDPAVRS